MDINKFTIKAQEVVTEAQQLALANDQQFIENTHLLKALFTKDKDLTPHLLKKLGANTQLLITLVDKQLESLPKVQGGNTQLSQNAAKTLAKAQNHLKQFNDEYVSVEHILLALLESNDTTGQILKDNGINQKQLVAAIKELRQGESINSQSGGENFNALSKFAINLTEFAQQGKIDPVIGRDDEIRRVLQILTRRTKNNPILIGEPGVGKTAIAEGIAHRIVKGDVPENLKNKKLFTLDMGALIAGAKFKVEFEERLKSLIKEVTKSAGEIILFIDEIHTLVGAGGGEGAMDAANILKPALARGELRSIGATTLNEYQKYFEKDKALERRFQKVMVDEPDRESAISILRGIKEKYENHHKVLIKDEALIAAVELSTRYISDRFLPDKAIDLMDEAASKLRMEMNSKPEELDETDRKIMQLEIEREAIKREKDEAKLTRIKKELAELNDKRSALLSHWKNEKDVVEKVQATKELLEQLKFDAEKAEREGEYEKVAEIRYGKLPETEQNLVAAKEAMKALNNSGTKLIKEEVDAEEIADVVSKWTGIPLKKMLQSDKEKLLHLEDELQERVIGQEEAVIAVADAVRRSRSGLQDENRPIGSFLFLGSTGVGKTELAKALSAYLFNDEHAMTRIDMSEYQERHSVSRLVGSPPGYVGYDEGGQLTEAVRRKPYSVVLFDEIEKAHPDVFNTLLQVLDDGRLTDNKGREVNFKNTILIMTSNLGADIILSAFDGVSDKKLDTIYDKTKAQVLDILKQQMRPEFINRIDELIVFKPLNNNIVKEIVKLQLQLVQNRLKDKNIKLRLSEDGLNWFGKVGFEPQFGARPIKRLVQKTILNQLAKDILSGKVKDGDEVVLDVFDSQVVFRARIDNEVLVV